MPIAGYARDAAGTFGHSGDMSRYVGSHIPRRWRHAARPLVRPARGPLLGLLLLAAVAALSIWAITARLTGG